MSSTEQQQQREGEKVELPLQTSPYVQYSDLEDYKMQAYGTQGHLPAVDNSRQAGATDAPTLSGSGLSEGQAKVTDMLNRQGDV